MTSLVLLILLAWITFIVLFLRLLWHAGSKFRMQARRDYDEAIKRARSHVTWEPFPKDMPGARTPHGVGVMGNATATPRSTHGRICDEPDCLECNPPTPTRRPDHEQPSEQG